MNKETRLVLICAARMRQVLTNLQMVLKERKDLPHLYDNSNNDAEQKALEILDTATKALASEGLDDCVFPLNPMEGETAEGACRRIFGPWITNDVFGKGDWHARTHY